MVAESCPVTVSENLVHGEEGPLNGGGNHDPLKVALYLAAYLAACMSGLTRALLSLLGDR
jgi:hypothetical protein